MIVKGRGQSSDERKNMQTMTAILLRTTLKKYYDQRLEAFMLLYFCRSITADST
ncbi:hypothetical protein Mapa_012356 [Marchantia paleacea]|nr:hypothetical protein Mapa_012356 [Marchantia paleacea]